MKKLQIPDNVARSFHKMNFQLKKHSPEILVVAGIIGTVTSTVLACKATLKVDATLEKPKKSIERIHKAVENGFTDAGEEYTAEDSKKDLAIVYVQTGVELVKLYAPAVALGALSITALVASHNIMHKRNVALAAAYATVDRSFKDYRGRVVERFGKELDRELKYNIKAKEIEETVVDEKGKEKKVKKTVETVNITERSEFARCFDETCPGWTKDAEYNRKFLTIQQSQANDLLRRRGYVYLNEVYEMLGFDKTHAGHVVGWVYDEENPIGDNYIDFGIFDNIHDEAARLFVNGHERSVWLDFNVDGNVWELLK